MSTHSSTRRRRALKRLLAGACLLAAVSAAPAAAASRQGPSTQRLAVLLVEHRVHRAPSSHAPLLANVPARRPITGEQTVLPVLGRATGPGGIPWLRVLLPGRPNSSTGWIAQQGTRAASTGWRLRVELGRRRVNVYWRGALARVFVAVVGKPSTPTPTGSFFVEETMRMRPGEPGGPYGLALSARSDTLQEFEGGPGQIAIHGLENLGGILGSAESHGCVRVANASIVWLAERIGPGVPVSILA